MDKKQYIVVFKYTASNYYCIWYTNDNDGFIVCDGIVLHSQDIQTIENYCIYNNIVCNDEPADFDIATIKRWLLEKTVSIDTKLFLNVWNLVSDFAKSINTYFLGDEKEMNDVYEKLFFGNNLPTINTSGMLYVPQWMADEIGMIQKVMENAVGILDNNFGVQSR